MAMLRDFGTMYLRDVARYAIGYAAAGYPMLARTSSIYPRFGTVFPGRMDYQRGGLPPGSGAGALARNLALGATYEHVVQEAEARSTGREGQIEAAHRDLVPGLGGRSDREVSAPGVDGHFRPPSYRAAERRGPGRVGAHLRGPLWHRLRQLHGIQNRPLGPGPVFLQQLQLLEGFDLKAMGHGHPEYVHVITECAKLSFADREAWYGDPHFVDVPMAALLSKGYADRRRELVSDESSPELRPGAPDGRPPRLRTSSRTSAPG